MTALRDRCEARRGAATTLLIFGGFGPLAGVFVTGALQGGPGAMLLMPAFAALGFALLPWQTVGIMMALAVAPGLLAGAAALSLGRRFGFAAYAGAAITAGCAAEAIALTLFDLRDPLSFVATAAITALLCAGIAWRLSRDEPT